MVRRSRRLIHRTKPASRFSLSALLRGCWRAQCADGTGIFLWLPMRQRRPAEFGQSAARTLT
jgi:hypothetical protein